MLDSKPYAELRIPRPGGAILATGGCLFVLLFVAVATCNLFFANRLPVYCVVASILWLGLVLYIAFEIHRDEGIRRFMVNWLGLYSRYHFVRAMPATGKADSISVGYSIFWHVQVYVHVDTNAIFSLSWGAGQASWGDWNDWYVALSYLGPYPDVCYREVIVIGPSGSKARVEALGRRIIEFLMSVGVELTPGKNNCEFNTPAWRKHIEQADEPEPE